MPTRNTFSIRDWSNEMSSFGVVSVTGNAGNLAAQLALAATLTSAIENLTIGHLDKHSYQIIPLDSPITPSNVYAQRENKWLVTYMGDTSGKLFSLEIAAPDKTDNTVPNSDVADLSSTDWVAFVGAFEAYAKSPDNGTEAVTVIRAEYVGRNI